MTARRAIKYCPGCGWSSRMMGDRKKTTSRTHCPQCLHPLLVPNKTMFLFPSDRETNDLIGRLTSKQNSNALMVVKRALKYYLKKIEAEE